MSLAVANMPEWHDVDDATLARDIVTRYQPAVLRGFVKHWPSVAKARISDAALGGYLRGLDNGTEVDAISVPAQFKGRLFYNDAMNGFNFTRCQQRISAVVDQLLTSPATAMADSLAVQSAQIAACMPEFLKENHVSALHPAIQPRIWFGNHFIVPAHFDESNNIACVVSGRRKFTLFPPDQIANLYIGPLDFTPTSLPISMVDYDKPDFAQYPKFRDALNVAQEAILEPGDAIYIPTLWWHRVESLDRFNTLINYWWQDLPGATYKVNSNFYALYHCLISLKHLPKDHKASWAAIFNHYLFNDEDPASHLPAHARGILGPLSGDHAGRIKALLAQVVRQ